jgi:hypothetical protein
MTQIEVEIFDSKGRVRADHTPEEIARLPKERQARYKKLVEAATSAESAEAALKAATEAVHAAARAHADAVEHLDRTRPRTTFLDNWRAYKATA